MFKKYIPATLFFIFLLIVWEVTIRMDIIDSHILPSPVNILTSLFSHWDELYPHIVQTSLETIIGLVISIILGLVVAIALDISPWVRKTLYPLLITSQTIPMIALAPLFLVWFGFGILPKVIIVIL